MEHFPGHGDTHHSQVVISPSLAYLHDVELAPFKAAIKHQVQAAMTAHINVMALDREILQAVEEASIVIVGTYNAMQDQSQGQLPCQLPSLSTNIH